MKKYLILALLAVAAVAGVALHQCQQLKQEKQRLSANVVSLTAGTEQYKTEAGKNAARAQQLELTTGELKQQCADLQARLDDMGVQNKYLQRAVSAGTQTQVQIDTLVRAIALFTFPSWRSLTHYRCFAGQIIGCGLTAQ